MIKMLNIPNIYNQYQVLFGFASLYQLYSDSTMSNTKKYSEANDSLHFLNAGLARLS